MIKGLEFATGFAIPFAAGVAIPYGLIKRLEALPRTRERRVSPEELAQLSPWGRLAGVTTLLSQVVWFCAGAWMTIQILRWARSEALRWFVFPGVFLMSMELGRGVYELAFGVTGNGRRVMWFWIGPGIRKRGALRAGAAILYFALVAVLIMIVGQS